MNFDHSERAVVFAPRGRDAEIATSMLRDAGIESIASADFTSFVAALHAGSGFAVVTDEALRNADLRNLDAFIRGQEEWSDFPFILLTERGGSIERNPAAARYLELLRNVTFLERPFHPTTLISIAAAALRARRRQYEARSRINTIHEGEKQLRFALAAGKLGQWTLDLASMTLSASTECKAHFGRTEDEAFTYEDLVASVHPDDRLRMQAAVQRTLETGEDYDIEYRCVWRDGSLHWVQVRGRPELDAKKRARLLIGVSLDMTERKSSEEQLRASDARYRMLFETIESGFCVVEVNLDAPRDRPDYRVVEANPAFYEQTGFTEDVLGEWLRETAPDLEDEWHRRYDRIARTRQPERFEQGSALLGRWFDVYAFPIGEARSGRVAILFNDISARRNAEDRLRELNETLEALVATRSAERDRLWNLSQDMLARADYTGMMSAVSPAWTQILGWSETELLTRGYATFMHPEDAPATLEAIAGMAESRRPARFENRIAAKSGQWKHIEWTVAPEPDGVNFIAVGRDLTLAKARETELETAREALRQSQKMEAMGSLTGGVAHDFNNLLTPILGSLDMLTRKGLGNDRERRLIDGALQSAERAKTLVQRLLAFARRQPLQATAVDIGQLAESMLDLIGSTLGPNIELDIDLAPDLPPANADANQLEMALLNLAVNARDAMPDGGKLTVVARHETLHSSMPPGLEPGHYILLRVRDTGMGMDKATSQRAVEPFFSTKGVGKGTGLGLSMVHGLAAQLGGGLTIESAPGAGTTITLWLPVSETELTEEKRPVAAPQQGDGLGIALLVDDDDLVRMSTADMLSDLGYEVVEAASAKEALQYMKDGLQPAILVTDHLMPGMSGAELAHELKRDRPDLPVLIVSGYAEIEGIDADLPRLIKPFRAADLEMILSKLSPAVTS